MEINPQCACIGLVVLVVIGVLFVQQGLYALGAFARNSYGSYGYRRHSFFGFDISFPGGIAVSATAGLITLLAVCALLVLCVRWWRTRAAQPPMSYYQMGSPAGIPYGAAPAYYPAAGAPVAAYPAQPGAYPPQPGYGAYPGAAPYGYPPSMPQRKP